MVGAIAVWSVADLPEIARPLPAAFGAARKGRPYTVPVLARDVARWVGPGTRLGGQVLAPGRPGEKKEVLCGQRSHDRASRTVSDDGPCLTATTGSRMTLESATMGKLLTRRRFTVEDYHRMGETGILPEDNRIELICGDIVLREPIGAYHAGTVNRLGRLLMSRLGDRAIVSVQNPVQFPREDTELQPDVMLLRPRDDFYTTRHPEAADVLLLIEVADTTLRLDRRVKIPLYARVGVQEVWLVDLTTARLEVRRQPLSDRYGSVRVPARGQRVAPGAFPDLSVDVADLMG